VVDSDVGYFCLCFYKAAGEPVNVGMIY